MRIPQNKVVQNYTAGNEFIRYFDKSEYIGHYYIIGGTQYFTGMYGDDNPLRIDKIENISKTKSINIDSGALDDTNIRSIHWVPLSTDISQGYADRYFVKKINSNPIQIKEVDSDTYDYVKERILYERIHIQWLLVGDNLNSIKGMVGLKEFVLG